MSLNGDDSTTFPPGFEADGTGTVNPQPTFQTGQTAGADQSAGPTLYTVPTQADLVLAQLAQANVVTTQLQQENAWMMRKIQEMLENMTNPKPKKITVSAPKSFDGKPKNYPAFISSLVTQFRADPHTYSTPESKVWYALSHMKEGIAELWARRMIIAIESGSYRIESWNAFESLMRLQFDSVNRKLDAQRNIANFRQGSKTAEEFFTQFEDYRADADFGEEAIIFFLKEALNPGILSKMVFMPNQPKTYDEFKKAAYFFDRQYRENKERSKPSSSATNNTPKPKPNTPTTTATTTTSITPTPTPNLDAGTPMDVDRLRAMSNKFPNILCYNCNRMGHYSSSCPEPRRKPQSSNNTTTTPSPSTSSTVASPHSNTNPILPRTKTDKTIRQMYDELDAEQRSDFIRGIAQDFLPRDE